MSFTYTQNIPNPPNLPSQDVKNMQTNTNSIFSIINVDHESFGSALNIDGRHKQVSLINQTAPGVPGNIGGVIFANNPAGTSQPFWQNAASTTQLFGFSSTTAPVAANPGLTYLPGGLIMIFSSQTIDNNAQTIRDNSPFLFPLGGFPTNCFTVLFNAEKSSTGAEGLWIKSGTLSNTGFTIKTSASSGQLSPFYYVAIGN